MKKLYTSKLLLLALCTFLLVSACKKDPIDIPRFIGKTEILVAPFINGEPTGKLLILDADSNIIKEKVTDGVAGNFQRWDLKGKIRYTYLVNDKAGYHIPGFMGYVPGYYVIADENLDELKRIYLQSHGNVDASEQKLLDFHDFILFSDDHYMVMAYYEKRVNNIPAHLNPAPNQRVIADIIQEVKNGQVIWQWDATDYPELYEESVENNDFSDSTKLCDYLHINSMTIDPKDNNVVCSFRNADMVMKINRNDGSIMWKMGGKNNGFNLTPDQKFYRQHHATFIDKGATMLLFDNGVSGARDYSRVLEIQFNESAKQITSFKATTIPDIFAQYMGSVQKIDNKYFIGGGSTPYIMELDAETGEKLFEMKLEKSSYRAFKYIIPELVN